MAAWFEEIFGADYGPIVMWSLVALASLVFLLLIYSIFRRMFSGTFVSGGRGRRPRLAIMDAAAVDSRRRLVLIRRDDTEHLILIGGPTDVVIEQGIRHEAEMAQTAKSQTTVPAKVPSADMKTERTVRTEAARVTEPAPAPVTTRPAATTARPAEPVAKPPPPPPARETVPLKTTGVASAAIPLPTEQARIPGHESRLVADRHTISGNYSSVAKPAAPEPLPSPAAALAPSAVTPETSSGHEKNDLDLALLRELEATLDSPRPAGAKSASLDDDMAEMIADMERERV